jgi:two-component system phosphate regulon response regulator PhoB
VVVADTLKACRSMVRAAANFPGLEVIGPVGAIEALMSCERRTPQVVLVDAEIREIPHRELIALLHGRAPSAGLPILVFGPNDGDAARTTPRARPQRFSMSVRPLRRPVMGRRRSGRMLCVTYDGQHLHADFDHIHVIIDDENVDLTRQELRLLQYLVSFGGDRVITRRELLAQVWDGQTGDVSRTVDTHVQRLRMKLPAATVQIQTVNHLGYRFVDRSPMPASRTAGLPGRNK